MRHIILLLVVLIVCSCATLRKEGPAPEGKPSSLTVISSRSRMTELEPCGCSARLLGGIKRESKLAAQWKQAAGSNVLYVASGQTFVPQVAQWLDSHKSEYAAKAESIVKALNDLGVQVSSPSINDFALGLDVIQKLQHMAKFKMVSANILLAKENRPALEPYVEFEYGGTTVLVTGITKFVRQDQWPTDNRVITENPATALDKVFAERPKANFVILLSDLDPNERFDIIREFPQIRLVLGATGTDANREAIQKYPRTLILNQLPRGWDLAKVTMELGSGPFYNQENGEHLASERSWRKDRIVVLEKQLAKTKNKKRRETILFLLGGLKRFLRDTDDIPTAPAAGQLTYSSTVQALTKDFDDPSTVQSAPKEHDDSPTCTQGVPLCKQK